jgi:hypothetical protein
MAKIIIKQSYGYNVCRAYTQCVNNIRVHNFEYLRTFKRRNRARKFAAK